MFYKILNFVIVYILSVINFAIILLPLWAIITPLIIANSKYIQITSIISIILLVFIMVSILMIIFLFFDFVFGFSVKGIIKNTKNYKKIKDYDIFTDIFEDIKKRFNKKNVKLMISPSMAENAYAVGNMGRQYIVITKGLISLYLIKFKKPSTVLTSVKCVLGHEMAHLVNKDYLPGLLLEINRKAIKTLSNFVFIFFKVIIRTFELIPVVGRSIAWVIMSIYNLFDSFINFFYKFVILSIYKFIQLKINRKKEYRCDKQSSEICGGDEMALALSVLGESGYMTIFSSHPKTKDRMLYVKNIKKSDENKIIKPEFGNGIVNLISILFVIFFPLIAYYFVSIEDIQKDYFTIFLHFKTIIRHFKVKILSFRINLHLNN